MPVRRVNIETFSVVTGPGNQFEIQRGFEVSSEATSPINRDEIRIRAPLGLETLGDCERINSSRIFLHTKSPPKVVRSRVEKFSITENDLNRIVRGDKGFRPTEARQAVSRPVGRFALLNFTHISGRSYDLRTPQNLTGFSIGVSEIATFARRSKVNTNDEQAGCAVFVMENDGYLMFEKPVHRTGILHRVPLQRLVYSPKEGLVVEDISWLDIKDNPGLSGPSAGNTSPLAPVLPGQPRVAFIELPEEVE